MQIRSIMHTQVHHNTCDFYIAAGVGGPIKHGTKNSHSDRWQTKLGIFFQVPLSFYMTSTSSIIIVPRHVIPKRLATLQGTKFHFGVPLHLQQIGNLLRQNCLMDSSSSGFTSSIAVSGSLKKRWYILPIG